jgi:hypothetical protein
MAHCEDFRGPPTRETMRSTELSEIFSLEQQKKDAEPTPRNFGLEFGFALSLEIQGELGMVSIYSHDEDSFRLEKPHVFKGAEIFVQKAFFKPIFQSSDFRIITRANFELTQGEVSVRQSGIQNRKLEVTQRIFRAHAAILGLKTLQQNWSGGAAIGIGGASLDQIGLGVTDSFFATSYFPLIEILSVYQWNPDFAIVSSIRKINLESNPHNSASAVALTVGIAAGF